MFMGAPFFAGGVFAGPADFLHAAPTGAIGWIDFQNDTYRINGVDYAVTDIFGGTFDASQITTAGMAVTDTNIPILAGALESQFIDGLTNGMTVVVSFDTATIQDAAFLTVYSGASSSASSDYLQTWWSGGNGVETDLYDDASLGVSDYENWDGKAYDANDFDLNVVGMTFAKDAGGGNYEYALCLNGGKIETQTVAYNPSVGGAVTAVDFLHADADSILYGTIRNIAIYPALVDADLVTATKSGFPHLIARHLAPLSVPTATTHTIAFETSDPGPIADGEMLVVLLSSAGNPTFSIDPSSGAGWTIGDQVASGTQFSAAWVWKIADGDDGLVVATTSSVQVEYISFRVAYASGIEGAHNSGVSADLPAAPTLAPAGGAAKYLWLLSEHSNASYYSDVPPAGTYHRIFQQGGGSGASLSTAHRCLEAASYSPGTWSAPSTNWICFTLAIKP